MDESAILDAGVAGLSAAFRTGRTTPVEALDMYRDRIARLDPVIGAYTDLRLDEARTEAEASHRRWQTGEPLSGIDGIPVAVKANIAVEGLPCHAGIAAYRDDIASSDADTVGQLRKAGALILGTLNMHEGALGATTDNEAFGRTHNPRRPGYTPGGSSGGSAAAVAGGLAAASLGSDTMGSVRIPSAYCGCTGHKPSPDLVPTGGVVELSHTLDHVGPHARSVEDLQVMMECLAGEVVQTPERTLEAIRFGVWDGAGDVTVEQTVSDGFSNAISAIRDAGAECTPVIPPDYAYGSDRRAGLLISEREAAKIHATRLEHDPEGFSKMFRKLMSWGSQRPEEEYEAALQRVKHLRSYAVGVFESVDFILAPVAPQTAFSFDSEAPANQADFTAWANFAGLPATALPTGLSPEGLPLALQVIGPAGLDAETLCVGLQLENVFGRLPVANPAI